MLSTSMPLHPAATGNVGGKSLPEYPCRHEHRWRADHLLRQRSNTPHAASRRIQGRASPRSPRRETGDTEGKERGSDNG